MLDLNTIWFLLVGVLVIGYAILDGFDLGIGSLYYLLAKNDTEKRTLLNAVGPFWDANEVWLLTGGGALFAAFPPVYATVFSGFYLALMLVLMALIFRAVAIEFRSRAEHSTWTKTWDLLFFLGSLLPALLFGVALGNVARGLPLDAARFYTGGFFGLLNLYALLLGLIGLLAFLLQGTTYALLKTDGAIARRARELVFKFWLAFVLLLLAGTVHTIEAAPALFANYFRQPLLWIIPGLTWLAILVLPLAAQSGRAGLAFALSSATLAGIILILWAGLYPNLVPATDPALSLNIYNAASSPLTLKTMLIIALIGMPLVLLYTVYFYRVFRGKASAAGHY